VGLVPALVNMFPGKWGKSPGADDFITCLDIQPISIDFQADKIDWARVFCGYYKDFSQNPDWHDPWIKCAGYTILLLVFLPFSRSISGGPKKNLLKSFFYKQNVYNIV
jgi:hypothetical protein